MRKQQPKGKADSSTKKQRKKVTWDKLMMVVIIAVCIEIVIYSEVAMWVKDNFDALYVLLGIPAAMFGVFWAYAEKSKTQNSAGGITYEIAMKDIEQQKPVKQEVDPDKAAG